MRIKTNRTIIRPIFEQDIDDIFEITSNDEVVSMVGWKRHTTIEETKKLICKMILDEDVYSIELSDSKKVIGTIGIHKKPANSGLEVGMLAIILNKDFWGQNYAYEVTKAVLEYLFETVKVHKVNVGHFSFNMQSKKVIEKLGFVYEGTKREVIIKDGILYDALEYSMLKRDYLK